MAVMYIDKSSFGSGDWFGYRFYSISGFGLLGDRYLTVVTVVSGVVDDDMLLLPHNLYSGANHVPFFYCSCWRPFIVIRQKQ